MKFKAFSLAAIAAILFTACDKEEGAGTPDLTNDQDKSVFLKFDSNVNPVSRSAEISGKGTKATLNTAMIYFADGNTDNSVIYTVKQVGGTGADLAMSELVKGHEFTKISDKVKYVYVVGNFDNSANNQSANLPKRNGITLGEVKATTLNIEQSNNSSSPLSTLLDGIAPVVPYAGNEDEWKGTENTPGADDLMAAVSLTPLNSRIEVKKISYAGQLKSFNVEGIYINNYVQNSPLSLVQTAGMLTNNGSDWDKYDQAHVDFAYNAYSTMFDNVATAAQINQGTAEFTLADNKLWAYQVFGNSPDGARIIIKLTDVVDANDNILGDRYVTVKGFSNANGKVTNLERGKIYQLGEIPFTDDDLSIIPEPEEISIWVSVTVEDWLFETVNPIL